jgi:hypothetical protein
MVRRPVAAKAQPKRRWRGSRVLTGMPVASRQKAY